MQNDIERLRAETVELAHREKTLQRELTELTDAGWTAKMRLDAEIDKRTSALQVELAECKATSRQLEKNAEEVATRSLQVVGENRRYREEQDNAAQSAGQATAIFVQERDELVQALSETKKELETWKTSWQLATTAAASSAAAAARAAADADERSAKVNETIRKVVVDLKHQLKMRTARIAEVETEKKQEVDKARKEVQTTNGLLSKATETLGERVKALEELKAAKLDLEGRVDIANGEYFQTGCQAYGASVDVYQNWQNRRSVLQSHTSSASKRKGRHRLRSEWRSLPSWRWQRRRWKRDDKEKSC
jgi:DNA repair exonuclease SbcCD ATPase subunit